MEKDNLSGKERRKYLRLDSVFPVGFKLVYPDGKEDVEMIQGFTSNVGKGGICIEVNHLPSGYTDGLKNPDIRLALDIEIPLHALPARALVKVSWVKPVPDFPGRFMLGVEYNQINPKHNHKIMHFAWGKRYFPRIAIITIAFLIILALVNGYFNMLLIKGNKVLVNQLVQIVQESSIAKQKIKLISKEREDLAVKIDALQVRLKELEDEKSGLLELLRKEDVDDSERIKNLSDQITKLQAEKVGIQDALIKVQHEESAVTEDLLRLDKRQVELTQQNLDKMYQKYGFFV